MLDRRLVYFKARLFSPCSFKRAMPGRWAPVLLLFLFFSSIFLFYLSFLFFLFLSVLMFCCGVLGTAAYRFCFHRIYEILSILILLETLSKRHTTMSQSNFRSYVRLDAFFLTLICIHFKNFLFCQNILFC